MIETPSIVSHNQFYRDGPPVDLTSCDREPIQHPGGIQPSGFLIALTADWSISRMSANAPQWTGRPVEALLGTPLSGLLQPDAIHAVRNRMTALRGEHAIERGFGIALFGA